MGTDLEKCMATMIRVFNEHSGKESGDPHKLDQSELESIMQKELPNYFKAMGSKEKIGKLMETLDVDGDKQVSFKEFGMLVICLTMACHEYFVAQK